MPVLVDAADGASVIVDDAIEPVRIGGGGQASLTHTQRHGRMIARLHNCGHGACAPPERKRRRDQRATASRTSSPVTTRKRAGNATGFHSHHIPMLSQFANNSSIVRTFG